MGLVVTLQALLKPALVAGLLVTTGVHYLAVQLSKSMDEGGARGHTYPYSIVVAIILCEFIKLVVCAGMYVGLKGRGEGGEGGWSMGRVKRDLQAHFSWRTFPHFGVPAAVYAMENNLKYWVMKKLDSPMTFIVFSHIETPIVSFLSVTFLGRRLSRLQWLAVLLLMDGVMATEIAICEAEGQHSCARPADFPLAAILAVTVSVTVSAVAGIATEHLFKKEMETSIFLQNGQLYFWGVLVNMLALAFCEPGRYAAGTFEGFDKPMVQLIVLTMVLLGLLVSGVIKHMSNIDKCFASGAAIFVNAFISVWYGSFSISLTFVLGAAVVVMAIFMYAGHLGGGPPAAAAAGVGCGAPHENGNGGAGLQTHGDINTLMGQRIEPKGGVLPGTLNPKHVRGYLRVDTEA